ncbi:MFS transporter [Microbacterium keratanolyticum]|uniref:MFS transporter n=1 Tax=Microbacterium keratanolyticum TaxID=67574 RepID=UPI00364459F1
MSHPGIDAVPHPVTEPLPNLAHRPALRDTFIALGGSKYRRYILSFIGASSGAWLARLTSDWLMIELTGSVALVSLVVAAQLVPVVTLSAWGGLLGDRLNARVTVLATQTLMVLAVALLALATLFGQQTVGLILLSSLLIGLSAAFEGPSRAVLVVEVVGTWRLSNALSLNAAVGQLAGIAGAALTGILILWIDVGGTLIVATLFLLAGIAVLLTVRRDSRFGVAKVPARRGQVAEAFRYVRRKPEIMACILLIFTLALFGLTGSVLMAWAARERFDLGAAGYSGFQAIAAIGAFVGSLVSARRRRLRLQDNALLLGVSGMIWAVTGFAPAPGVFAIALVAAFITRIMFMIGNESLAQLSTNGAIRGRVVSLYLMAATSGQLVGAMLTGWAVVALGGEITFLITGVVLVVVSFGVWFRCLRDGRRLRPARGRASRVRRSRARRSRDR